LVQPRPAQRFFAQFDVSHLNDRLALSCPAVFGVEPPDPRLRSPILRDAEGVVIEFFGARPADAHFVGRRGFLRQCKFHLDFF